ncbi:hypothetical protein [Pantanalinema sp. GBBB05]|uniref:hypothetical protein n=1 Tax=Pantanalinema sp. GBBB05 TaxID=2604139 RepID=UPI001E069BBE|nr:hypothetical protein [Pantanalinema sp. GBBB05]
MAYEATADAEVLTNARFVEILTEIISELTPDQLLAIGDVYTTLAEHFNNDVIDRWQQRLQSQPPSLPDLSQLNIHVRASEEDPEVIVLTLGDHPRHSGLKDAALMLGIWEAFDDLDFAIDQITGASEEESLGNTKLMLTVLRKLQERRWAYVQFQGE